MAYTGPAMTKQEAAEAVRTARTQLGLTWAQIAEAIGRPVAWTTAALLGQHLMSADEAAAAGLRCSNWTRTPTGAAAPADPRRA